MQIALLLPVGRLPGGRRVVIGRRRDVACRLKKMGAYRMKATVGVDPWVEHQPPQQFETRFRALDHAEGDA